MTETRVLMVEMPLFTHFVKNATRQAIFGMQIIDVTKSSELCLELIQNFHLDVLVVDLRSRSYALYANLKAISVQFPKLLIIGRVNDPNINYILDAIDVGVMGFIDDRTSYEELVQAIHTIRDGYPYLPQNVINKLSHNLQARTH